MSDIVAVLCLAILGIGVMFCLGLTTYEWFTTYRKN